METTADVTRFFAFSAEHVSALTGLSEKQLSYWHTTDFYSPEHVSDRRAFGRIYSFRDLVGLRTIALLKERGVSLQHMRKVKPWLEKYHETPWASLRLFVVEKRIVLVDPDTGKPMEALPPNQMILPIELEPIANDVRVAVEKMRQRSTEEIGKIKQNRFVLRNEPVLAGTRVPTAAIWNFHAAGYTAEQIVEEYPQLTLEDVTRALEYERVRREKNAG